MRAGRELMLLVAIVAGCSESSDGPGTPAGADTGAALDAASDRLGPVDAPVVVDASVDSFGQDAPAVDAAPDVEASAPEAGASTHTGFVTVRSNTAPAQTRAVATFLVGGPAYRCTEEAFGACSYVSCAPRVPRDPLPAPHAGVLTVSGGLRSLSLAPGTDGTYDVVLNATPFWAGGEKLTLSAAGSAIGAFQGDVTAPARVVLSAPSAPAGDLSVARAAGLDLAWAGGDDEEVLVLLGTNASADPEEIECRFAARDKKGVVPAAALSKLPVGEGYFSVATRRVTPIAAGAWTVRWKAESDAVFTSGALAMGSLMLK